MNENPQIEIRLDQSDIDDFLEGRAYIWTFPTDQGGQVDVHIFKE